MLHSLNSPSEQSQVLSIPISEHDRTFEHEPSFGHKPVSAVKTKGQEMAIKQQVLIAILNGDVI